jgi:hypothetical protein
MAGSGTSRWRYGPMLDQCRPELSWSISLSLIQMPNQSVAVMLSSRLIRGHVTGEERPAGPPRC